MSGRTFTLQLAGLQLTLHRLKLGQIEDLDLLNLQQLPELEAAGRALDALVAAARPSHPDITRKQIADLLDMDDLALILPAVMTAAGFEQVRERLGNELGLLPGAGRPSTPTSPPAST